MAVARPVSITGLNEAVASFRLLGTEAQKALKANLSIAAEPVRATAERSLPKRSGKLAGSVKTRVSASARRTTVSVRMGGARTPYAGWIEFGGVIRGAGRGRNQNITREFHRDGRYLNPALDTHRHQVLERIQKALTDSIDRTF